MIIYFFKLISYVSGCNITKNSKCILKLPKWSTPMFYYLLQQFLATLQFVENKSTCLVIFVIKGLKTCKSFKIGLVLFLSR